MGTVLYPSAHKSSGPSSLEAGAGVRQQPEVIGTALYPSALSHQVSSTPILHRRACLTLPPSCGGVLTCTDEKFERKQESSGLTPGRATLRRQPPVAGGVRSEGTVQRTSWRTKAKARRRFSERDEVAAPMRTKGESLTGSTEGARGSSVRRCAVGTGSLHERLGRIVIRFNRSVTRLQVESKQDREASILHERLGRIVIRFNRSVTRIQSDVHDVSRDMNCVSIHKHNSGPLHARCHFGPKTFAAQLLQR